MASIAIFTGCQPNEINTNGLENTVALDPSFVITPASGVTNTYNLVAKTQNIISSKWNLGDGKDDFFGLSTQKIFLPDAGNYTIVHNAMGKGGIFVSSNQVLNVPTADAVSGNLVKGGRFTNVSDHNQWTILNIAGTTTKWSFNAGSATIKGTSGGWDQQGIYQAIQVVAGRKYKIDMSISGSPASNTWFEVYASPTAPVQNNDYTSLGRRIGLSTWDGCATSNYSGQLSVLRCVGSGNEVTFSTSGTIYLVIKSGGNNLGVTGITITNVEFRGSIG